MTAELLQNQKKYMKICTSLRQRSAFLELVPQMFLYFHGICWALFLTVSETLSYFFFKVSLVSKKNNKRPNNMGVSKNRGVSPKMDGENNGKPH